MKVGDLIYDDYYGRGIILMIEARDYTIFCFKSLKTIVLDEHMIEFAEVLNESR